MLFAAAFPGEPAPPAPVVQAAIAVDGSRTTADKAVIDRLRFLQQHLLTPIDAKKIEAVTFARTGEPGPDLGAATYAGRWADYPKAVSWLTAPESGPVLTVIAGDGLTEVVGSPTDTDPALLTAAGADASRDQINTAARQTALEPKLSAVKAAHRRWLLLDTVASPRPDSALSWIAELRPDAQRLNLRTLELKTLLPALTALGVPQPTGLTVAAPGDAPVAIPEANRGALIWLHVPGPYTDFTVSFIGPDGKELPTAKDATADTGKAGTDAGKAGADAGKAAVATEPRVTRIDDSGPCRVYRLAGVEAGGAYLLRRTAADAAAQPRPCEILIQAPQRVAHRLALGPGLDTDSLFGGDALKLTHTWTRAPGETAVSDALRTELEKDARLALAIDGATTEPLLQQLIGVILPTGDGKGRVSLVPNAAWKDRTDARPLDLKWMALGRLTLLGGFPLGDKGEPAAVIAGRPIRLDLRQAGGRVPLQALDVVLTRAEGGERTVALQRDPAVARGWTGEITFTTKELGAWDLKPPQKVRISATGPGSASAAAIESADVKAIAGKSLTLRVDRDWLPIILGLLLILLALLALFLWWWLTRPRFKAEVLRIAGRLDPLSGLPGRQSATSFGVPEFAEQVTFRATRSGVVVGALADGAALWINARPAQVGQSVADGNDLEVRRADGASAHARFFVSSDQAMKSSIADAQIDPKAVFNEEVVMLVEA
ncbi:hypothetical protein LBMAG53_10230 [Planctomycetota bacterium]|nr:hypothetical protein LBMAG53_10230 [Planctomycetota bacterium]